MRFPKTLLTIDRQGGPFCMSRLHLWEMKVQIREFIVKIHYSLRSIARVPCKGWVAHLKHLGRVIHSPFPLPPFHFQCLRRNSTLVKDGGAAPGKNTRYGSVFIQR